MQHPPTLLFLVFALIIFGYAIYKSPSLGEEPTEEKSEGGGSGWAFLFLLVLFLSYAFNYAYSLLSPWDPLGLYQRNRTYMGITV